MRNSTKRLKKFVTKLVTEVFVRNAIPDMCFRFGLSDQRFPPKVVFGRLLCQAGDK